MILTAAALTGVSVAVGNQGSQNNPLVTLSYLNEVAIPEILEEVDGMLDERAEEFQGGGSGSASFQAVEVPKGKKLVLSAGAQVLFRSGKASSSPDLTDLTEGVSTGTLTKNHLYLATIEEQSVTASADCTVMVLGNYRVSS